MKFMQDKVCCQHRANQVSSHGTPEVIGPSSSTRTLVKHSSDISNLRGNIYYSIESTRDLSKLRRSRTILPFHSTTETRTDEFPYTTILKSTVYARLPVRPLSSFPKYVHERHPLFPNLSASFLSPIELVSQVSKPLGLCHTLLLSPTTSKIINVERHRYVQYHQLNPSSIKSTTPSPCTSLTAFLTLSVNPPGPQTVTHMAPTRSFNSCSRMTSGFGRPLCTTTVLLGLLISSLVFGLVTNSKILRHSLLPSIFSTLSIHGLTHSKFSPVGTIQTSVILRVAMERFWQDEMR